MAAPLLIERNERRPPWTTAFAFREAQICRVKRNGRRFYEFPPAKSYSMQYRFVYRGSYRIMGRLENNRQRRMRDVCFSACWGFWIFTVRSWFHFSKQKVFVTFWTFHRELRWRYVAITCVAKYKKRCIMRIIVARNYAQRFFSYSFQAVRLLRRYFFTIGKI